MTSLSNIIELKHIEIEYTVSSHLTSKENSGSMCRVSQSTGLFLTILPYYFERNVLLHSTKRMHKCVQMGFSYGNKLILHKYLDISGDSWQVPNNKTATNSVFLVSV